MTQGAVSHQVKALEAELGLKLFSRERQRLVITEAGRTYLEVVRDAFDRSGMGTERLLQRQKSGAILSALRRTSRPNGWCTASDASPKRIPRIDLRVSATVHHVDFAREDIDLAIRHGDGKGPGNARDASMHRATVSGLQPEIFDRRKRCIPADMSIQPLLHTNGTKDWEKWLEPPRRANRSIKRARL